MSRCLIILAVLLAVPLKSFAAISFDRTRIIYNEDSESVALKIKNENQKLPYLAQVWIEDENGKKDENHFGVVPPIQRVEPSDSSFVRLLANQLNSNKLPKDRESVFYFNLREIPPKSDKPNTLQIALQTRVKLFYRPQGIYSASKQVWQEALLINDTNGKFTVSNNSPFNVTIVAFGFDGNWDENSTPFMIAPFSEKTFDKAYSSVSKFEYVYVNDYGGKPTASYSKKNGKFIIDSK